jgi:hypothetical protein
MKVSFVVRRGRVNLPSPSQESSKTLASVDIQLILFERPGMRISVTRERSPNGEISPGEVAAGEDEVLFGRCATEYHSEAKA